MPINFQQIRSAIQKFGQEAPTQAKLREQNLEIALTQLKIYSQELDPLQERLQLTLTVNPYLRCALPTNEPINTTQDPMDSQQPVVLLAADGSQIIPNQHLAVQFGVINVGLMRLEPGITPVEQIESHLLYADEIFTEQGFLIGEEVIALRRDYKERSHLLNEATKEEKTVLTFTDGPLELYREGKESAEYRHLLEDYLHILAEMANENIITAGYVDKPRSDLLIRLLELPLLSEDQLPEAGHIRKLAGITDADLFARILQPNQRSAIFQLHSRSAQHFSGLLAIHFFYINIGRLEKPQIARVEIPAWVLRQPSNIDLIHYHLIDQSQIMGIRAYPYILHRAHEVALVSYQEREHLQTLLQQTLLGQGLAAGDKSSKQYHKDLSGKTRYRG
ncbi:MAG: DNA double-strand break repair nuclease NurA [Anaerolineaceae bacterium]|nr:DNA double-strand break repair nuclease NurA [Anaerolineaceae bacterium]